MHHKWRAVPFREFSPSHLLSYGDINDLNKVDAQSPFEVKYLKIATLPNSEIALSYIAFHAWRKWGLSPILETSVLEDAESHGLGISAMSESLSMEKGTRRRKLASMIDWWLEDCRMSGRNLSGRLHRSFICSVHASCTSPRGLHFEARVQSLWQREFMASWSPTRPIKLWCLADTLLKSWRTIIRRNNLLPMAFAVEL